MNYYDKYFRYYKDIMKPVLEWKKELEVKDRKRLSWYLWGGLVLVGVELVAMTVGNTVLGKIHNSWYGIVSIGVLIIVALTVRCWERLLGEEIGEYKQKIAINYHEESFLKLEEAKEEEFIDKLITEKINTKEQYRILIDAVDRHINAYKPKQIFNYGALGALLLPVWNTFIGKLFETENIMSALGVSGVIILLILYVFFLSSKLKDLRNDIFKMIHSDIYKLQGMKACLLEIEIQALSSDLE